MTDVDMEMAAHTVRRARDNRGRKSRVDIYASLDDALEQIRRCVSYFMRSPRGTAPSERHRYHVATVR